MESCANFVSWTLHIFLVCVIVGGMTNTPGYAVKMKSLKDKPNKKMSFQTNSLRFDLTRTIGHGVELAHQQCMENFKWERWNCSEVAFSRRYISPMTREMAYVASITAAGISHSVAKLCFKGAMLPECSCRKSKDGFHDFSEEGCLSSLRIGQWIGREFLNNLEKRDQDIIASINSHNYEIGFKATELNAGEQCKCHGVSGSCTTKTCWKRIAPFPEVGDHLKVAYKRAIKVAINRNNFGKGQRKKFGNLLFMDNSPNYCEGDASKGWFGTKDRQCSKNKNVTDESERKSCNELCKVCGHKVRSRTVVIARRCNCKVDWCCGVTCNICTTTEIENYCHSPKNKRFKSQFNDFTTSERLYADSHLF